MNHRLHFLFRVSTSSLCILLLSCVLIVSCKDDDGEFEQIIIRTNEVGSVENVADQFGYQIISGDLDQIIEVGFVWDPEYASPANMRYRISLGEVKRQATYQPKVHIAAKKHFLRAYCRTEQQIIYGNEVIFQRFTRSGPVVSNIEPSIGYWQDTVKINGTYFSVLEDGNQVFFDRYKADIIDRDEESLVVIVPNKISNTESIVGIVVDENDTVDVGLFKIGPPVISHFTPESSKRGIMKIYGKGLRSMHNRPGVNVVFEIENTDQSWSSYVQTHNNHDSIAVNIPFLEGIDFDVYVEVLGQKTYLPNTYTNLAPYVLDFNPKKGGYGDTISFSVKNVENINDVRVSTTGRWGGTLLNVGYHDDVLKVKMPGSADSKFRSIRYKTDYSTWWIELDSLFEQESPIISQIVPDRGTYGDTISILGSNFSLAPNDNLVILDEVRMSVLYSSGDSVAFKVSDDLNPNNGQTPVTLFISDDLNAQSGSNFELKLHEIESVDKYRVIGGNDLIVYGKYFNSYSERNMVKLGGWDLEVVSSTFNRITCVVPNDIEPGNYNLEVIIGDRTVAYNESIEVLHNPWTRKADYPVLFDDRYYYARYNETRVDFSLNSYGYSLTDESNDQQTWQYNPIDDNWSQKATFELNYILGHVANDNINTFLLDRWGYLHSYDANMDEWSKLNEIPRKQWLEGISVELMFGIGNSLFAFGEFYNYNVNPVTEEPKLWKYSISSDSWSEIETAGFENYSDHVMSAITINSKAYIFNTGDYILEFDPYTNTLNEKLNLSEVIPRFSYDKYIFNAVAMNEKIYVFSSPNGYFEEENINNVYEFDPQINSLVQLVTTPFMHRVKPTIFTINDKIYIGAGEVFGDCLVRRNGVLTYCSEPVTDFWEFDPSKLSPE